MFVGCRPGDGSGVGLRASDHRRDLLGHSVVGSGVVGQRTQSLPGEKPESSILLYNENNKLNMSPMRPTVQQLLAKNIKS